MSNLNEFAINLPMAGVGAVGNVAVTTAAPAMEPCADMTAKMTMPADIDPMSCDHIGVYVDSANVVNYDPCNPMVCVDMVMTVTITPPGSGTTSSYKMVKRISMDKVKLACQAEGETPVSVVEEETPEQVEKMMAEYYATQRARELSGLTESAGTKTFKVLFSFDDVKANAEHPNAKHTATATVNITHVSSKERARHVWGVKFGKHAKYPNAKITRVTEVTTESVSEESLTNYDAWIKKVRKTHPDAQIHGDERSAQMVDWSTKNSKICGEWNGKSGTVTPGDK